MKTKPKTFFITFQRAKKSQYQGHEFDWRLCSLRGHVIHWIRILNEALCRINMERKGRLLFSLALNMLHHPREFVQSDLLEIVYCNGLRGREIQGAWRNTNWFNYEPNLFFMISIAVAMPFIINRVSLGDNECILSAGDKVLCLSKIHDKDLYCDLVKEFKFRWNCNILY